MFTVYCNKCFSPKTLTNPNKYFISKCGHIFCQPCKPDGRCRVCKAHFISKAIDGNMPKSMAPYFEPPEKIFRRFQKIVQFQVKQDSYNANYWVNYVPQQIKDAMKRLNGMTRIDEHLSEKLAQETNRIDKLKKYLAYKKKCVEDFDQDSIPSQGRYNLDDQRPKTPTISTLSNVTLSTVRISDVSRQSDSFTKRGRVDFSM